MGYAIRTFAGLLGATLGTTLLASVTFAQTATPVTLNVSAGVGSGTTAGNVYLPGEMTIHIGDSVTWTIDSDEPHSVTFGPGPTNVASPSWPVAGFPPPPATPPGPPQPVSLGPVDYDGSAFVNSGLLIKGSTVTLRFTNAGDFDFYCVSHPGMSGTVHVVAADQPATSQDAADAKAQAAKAAILAQIQPLVAKTDAAVTSTKRADETKLWSVFTDAVNPVSPSPGGGTGYLEILQFFPVTLTISVGDTVQWNATAPHTVTFPPPGEDYHALGSPLSVPAAKPSENYDGKSLYNSGVLHLGVNAPTAFTLTFPMPGDFHYVCLLHADEGQLGLIHVSARPNQAALPATGGASPTVFAVAAVVGLLLVLGGIVVRSTAGPPTLPRR